MKENTSIAVWLSVALVMFGVGCSSVQNLSHNKDVRRDQLAMIRVLSGDPRVGQTMVVMVDDVVVDATKEFVAIAPGTHRVSVDFYREMEPTRKPSRFSKVMFGGFIPDRNNTDQTGVIRSTSPKVISCQLLAGKSYFVEATNTFNKVRKVGTGTNDWAVQTSNNAGNLQLGWEFKGSWSVRIRELK